MKSCMLAGSFDPVTNGHIDLIKRAAALFDNCLLYTSFAVLLQGVTDYVWYNYRIFLLFWLIIGLTSAIGRTARADRIYRDEMCIRDRL